MKAETKVGKFLVPIKNYKRLSIVDFSRGLRGKHEEGQYCFWTAVLKKKKDGKRIVWGRARPILSPGERFCRMKGKKDYREIWLKFLERGKNVKFIRPSTKKEISWWASGHVSDWKFAETVSIGKERFVLTEDLAVTKMALAKIRGMGFTFNNSDSK